MTVAQTQRAQENLALLGDPKVKAFLDTIAAAEGTHDAYNMVVYDKPGRGSITDFDAHPNVKRTQVINGVRTPSTAAGRYQFLYKTYGGLAKATGLTDFSPQSQDVNAVELLRQIGAIAALQKGDLATATREAATQWAGLPGALAKSSGQSSRSAASVTADYARFLAAAGIPQDTANAFARAPASTDKAAQAMQLFNHSPAAPPVPAAIPSTPDGYEASLREFVNANTTASLDQPDLAAKLAALTPRAQPETQPQVYDSADTAISALAPQLDANQLSAQAEQYRADAMQAMFGGQTTTHTQLPDTIERAINRILGEETNGAA